MKNHLCRCATLLVICTFTLVQQVLQAQSTPLVQVHYLETQISDPPEDFEDPFDFHESWGGRFKQHGDSYFHIRWPGAVVRHHISADFEPHEVDIILNAMKEIEAKSCVRFVTQASSAGGALVIKKNSGGGCVTISAPKHRKNPSMSLDPQWCVQHGRILHELMHALGFSHEHQRPDRDDYVAILWKNIKDEHKEQFRKRKYPLEETRGFVYDYSSILHYSNISFHAAIDPHKPIIIAREHAPQMGQRKQLDYTDVEKLNLFYRCTSAGHGKS